MKIVTRLIVVRYGLNVKQIQKLKTVIANDNFPSLKGDVSFYQLKREDEEC